ncbi:MULTISPECIES: anthranilate synthase component II [Staphylococcus]|uniref:Aminodeoxychorismate/anthranilate synthase component II n=1 Tax=Staphylococcus hsinchuensis TaxID=3051183 RepID=A0ABZ3EB48_9STAP|nr:MULTISPECIES: aminodeoxychorismate/anthranilate synthase component II [unclassified Staphylococcus]
MILIVDNYDSFTYNLVDMVAQQTEVIVKYPDDPKVFDYQNEIDGIIISPGPGHPLDTNLLMRIIEHYQHKPILGVCLGSQALSCFYGGEVIQGENIKHGKTDRMKIVKRTQLYENITEYSEIMRYHSLITDPKSLPTSLIVTAETPDCIQGLQHKMKPHFGIQYHPESFATEHGTQIIINFLKITQEVKHDATSRTN